MFGRIKNAASHAGQTLTGADRLVAQASAVLVEGAEVLDDIRENGLDLSFSVGENKLPIGVHISIPQGEKT